MTVEFSLGVNIVRPKRQKPRVKKEIFQVGLSKSILDLIHQ